MNNTTDDNTTVDLNALIIDFVKRFPFPSDVKRNLDLDNITKADIDDKDLIIDQTNVEYSRIKDLTTPLPTVNGAKKTKGNKVYSCEFNNNTSKDQETEFEAHKETKSITHVSFSKSMVKEGSFSLNLAPPTTMLQASAAFKQSLTVDNRREINTEETTSWNARAKIIVPAHKNVVASMIIDEKHEAYEFKITSIIRGTMKIWLKNKKTGWKMNHPLEINNLTDVFPKNLGFVKNADNSITFISHGKTSSKFGIAQRITLKESDATPDA